MRWFRLLILTVSLFWPVVLSATSLLPGGTTPSVFFVGFVFLFVSIVLSLVECVCRVCRIQHDDMALHLSTYYAYQQVQHIISYQSTKMSIFASQLCDHSRACIFFYVESARTLLVLDVDEYKKRSNLTITHYNTIDTATLLY